MDHIKTNKRAVAVGSVFVVMSGTSVFASNLGSVNASAIKLRDAASMNSNVLGSVTQNQIVRINGNDKGWTNVSTDTLTNVYMAEKYVDVVQTDATCMADTAHIKKTPENSAEALGTVTKGTVLVCTGVNGDFYAVKYNNQIGYIAKSVMSGSLLSSLGKETDENNKLTADDISKRAEVVKTVTQQTSATTGENSAATVLETAAATAQAPTVSACFEELTSAINAQVDIYAIVSSDNSAILMSKPATDSKAIALLRNGYAVDVYSYEDGWVEASDDDGNKGYLRADDIILMNGTKPENTSVNSALSTQSSEGASMAMQIVNFSQQWIGTPYVYGGTSLTAGVDCSGFTMSVYKQFGVNINRTSRDQYLQGTAVAYEDLQPGDLVFFNTGGNTQISHVGMYIGDNKYIHSTDGGNVNGVTISDISSAYAKRTYVGAKRILQ
jgi:cell wall-associated NlpC family hydrolase